jgi:hypothetical protein
LLAFTALAGGVVYVSNKSKAAAAHHTSADEVTPSGVTGDSGFNASGTGGDAPDASAAAALGDTVTIGPIEIMATASLMPGAEGQRPALVAVFVTNNSGERLPDLAGADVKLSVGGSTLDRSGPEIPLSGSLAAGGFTSGTYGFAPPTAAGLDDAQLTVTYDGYTATFRGAL